MRHEFLVTKHVLEGGIPGDMNDPNRQRDLFSGDTIGQALAVPTLTS